MSHEKENPFYVNQYINSTTYEIYFNEIFSEPKNYSRLFDMLRHLGENDIVRMHINSFGGNMFTGVQLINSMQTSPAHIVTILDGTAMSLAPLILFAGDSIEITDHSLIMFHDYSSSGGGKGSEQLTSATAMSSFYKGMLTKYATPFLTEDEIEDIVAGQDRYYNSEEIVSRLDLTESVEGMNFTMEELDVTQDDLDNAVKLTDEMVEELMEEDRQLTLELVQPED